MRTLEQDSKLTENGAEAGIENLAELQCRNKAKDDEVCINIPLQDWLRSPGHVPWKLIQVSNADRTDDFEFNESKFLLSLCRYGMCNKLGGNI